MNAVTPFAPPVPEAAALHPDHIAPDAAVVAAAAHRRQRHDGWTPDRQRVFLESIADGHSAEAACRLAGMSPSSAYAFRRPAAGAAFALGWRAASLIARDHVADAMLARAIDGQTETITRANGDVIERHRFDNRLAATMLARLDRMAEATDSGSAAANASARLVAQEFDGFLDLIERDAGPARAGLFVAARHPALLGAAGEGADLAPVLCLARADRYLRARVGAAAEVDTADLDPDARQGWTAEQWTRAEAAGLVALAPALPDDRAADDEDDAFSSPLSPLHPDAEDDDADEYDDDYGDEDDEQAEHHADEAPSDPDLFEPDGAQPVWFDEERYCWMTDFAPPAGYDGLEEGRYGDPDYIRELTLEEEALVEPLREAALARIRQAGEARRTAWFTARTAPKPATPATSHACEAPASAHTPPAPDSQPSATAAHAAQSPAVESPAAQPATAQSRAAQSPSDQAATAADPLDGTVIIAGRDRVPDAGLWRDDRPPAPDYRQAFD